MRSQEIWTGSLGGTNFQLAEHQVDGNYEFLRVASWYFSRVKVKERMITQGETQS